MCDGSLNPSPTGTIPCLPNGDGTYSPIPRYVGLVWGNCGLATVKTDNCSAAGIEGEDCKDRFAGQPTGQYIIDYPQICATPPPSNW